METPTASSPRLSCIAKMKEGDHYCGMYRTDEDHRALVVDFIRDGMARNEKMVYIINIHSAGSLRSILEAAGVDVGALVKRGQLVILTAKEAYLKDGDFDPDKMISLVRGEAEKALAEGYSALRVTGEMTWALSGEPGSERLVEYESKLNEFFPNSKCYAICQYDQRRFDPDVLLDILHTHPKVLAGTNAYDNEKMYFVPPSAFLSEDRQRGVFEQWLANLGARSEVRG